MNNDAKIEINTHLIRIQKELEYTLNYAILKLKKKAEKEEMSKESIGYIKGLEFSLAMLELYFMNIPMLSEPKIGSCEAI